MHKSVRDNLVEKAKLKDDSFAGQQYVDIHCHCLPGIDDGPATMSESLALCCALVADGITTVVATPHQLGRFSEYNEASQVREAVAALNEELKIAGIALSVMAGGDVRVDERICELLEADKILTLADGGKHILLELPHEVLMDIAPLIADLGSMGIETIISHPERHGGLAKEPRILLKWLECAAHLQVTAGSLLGDFGPVAQKFGWQLLNSGWAAFVATDSHDLGGRRPRMKAAFDSISSELGETFARLVCLENPLRVIKGQNIETVYSVGAGAHSDEGLPGRF